MLIDACSRRATRRCAGKALEREHLPMCSAQPFSLASRRKQLAEILFITNQTCGGEDAPPAAPPPMRC